MRYRISTFDGNVTGEMDRVVAVARFIIAAPCLVIIHATDGGAVVWDGRTDSADVAIAAIIAKRDKEAREMREKIAHNNAALEAMRDRRRLERGE